MDPGSTDAGEAADGARQLALQGAEPVHILLKGRGGQALAAAEDLPPHPAAGRQPFPRQQQAEAWGLVFQPRRLIPTPTAGASP